MAGSAGAGAGGTALGVHAPSTFPLLQRYRRYLRHLRRCAHSEQPGQANPSGSDCGARLLPRAGCTGTKSILLLASSGRQGAGRIPIGANFQRWADDAYRVSASRPRNAQPCTEAVSSPGKLGGGTVRPEAPGSTLPPP